MMKVTVRVVDRDKVRGDESDAALRPDDFEAVTAVPVNGPVSCAVVGARG